MPGIVPDGSTSSTLIPEQAPNGSDGGNGSTLLDRIALALATVVQHDDPFEIRIVKGPNQGAIARQFESGQFVEAARFALGFDGRCQGLYFLLNPIRQGPIKGEGAADDEIDRRVLLLIDTDPARPSGTSSTDAEKTEARKVNDAVKEFLRSLGFPDPIECDSGNGFHLLYLIELPNDEPSRQLLKTFLEALDDKFGTEAAEIDTTVHNASRICKLYETMACKGESTPERPHRRARLLKVPDDLAPVPREFIQAVADEFAANSNPPADPGAHWQGGEAGYQGRPKAKKYGASGKGYGHLGAEQLDDNELLKVAFASKSGPAIQALMRGDTSGHGNNRSRADMALCSHMAFYCGNDPSRIDRIVRSSELFRTKWDSRRTDSTYGSRTIDKALGWASDRYTLPTRPVVNRLNSHLVRMLQHVHPLTGNPIGDPFASPNGKSSGPDAKPSKDPGDPSQDEAPEDRQKPIFGNYIEQVIIGENGKPKTVRIAIPVEEISATLESITPGFPKRVDGVLFVEDSNHAPLYLDSPTKLFAWIDTYADVRWMAGATSITQERFYERLCMISESFEAIESMPHWPSMPGVFYMHPEVPAPGRNLLDKLLDFFRPYSPVDRELIRAFVLTPFWGGPPSRRPAFMFSGPDQEKGLGRGVGKTTLVDVLSAELFGGAITVSSQDEMSKIITRLLSPNARQTRIGRLDNVKSLRFSWDDLESIITTRIISGHAMFKGEGQRPNTLVWCITLNGASLSKDLAQRVIPIMLARPPKDPDWEDQLVAFIQANRWELIAEIGQALSQPPALMTAVTRWAPWEKHVLTKTDDFKACQAVILERQGAVDDDDDEQAIVRTFISNQIQSDKRCDPDEKCFWIPAGIVAGWVIEASGRKLATNQASAHLRTLGIKELSKVPRRGALGWIWRGKDAPRGAKAERYFDATPKEQDEDSEDEDKARV